MAAVTCPNGHPSESTDYCDTCGTPIDSGSGAPAAGPASSAEGAPKPLGVVCPNCAVMNAPGALFCEACGYDYTTGTMPRPPEPSVLDLDSPLPGAPEPSAMPADMTSAEASMTPDHTPAPPAPEAPSASAAALATPEAAGSGISLDIDAPTPSRPTPAVPAAGPMDRAVGDVGDLGQESDTFDWVLEVWVDPEWFALQDSPDPMPSAGLPEIVPLRKRSLLIGRPSRSRDIHPDIDCEPDSGISRRQAQLTTDGTRWFIEDLDSANGTFVAEASAPMPSIPIPPGRRRELSGDERIYLGAWTRLVLRRATPEEQEAYAG
ncbi:MAG: FHA domain-containing protein [Propionibacteriaceae bacterium]|nr:FHA domain-containing protein [Propionibacteriaceae bacterium]